MRSWLCWLSHPEEAKWRLPNVVAEAGGEALGARIEKLVRSSAADILDKVAAFDGSAYERMNLAEEARVAGLNIASELPRLFDAGTNEPAETVDRRALADAIPRSTALRAPFEHELNRTAETNAALEAEAAAAAEPKRVRRSRRGGDDA